MSTLRTLTFAALFAGGALAKRGGSNGRRPGDDDFQTKKDNCKELVQKLCSPCFDDNVDAAVAAFGRGKDKGGSSGPFACLKDCVASNEEELQGCLPRRGGGKRCPELFKEVCEECFEDSKRPSKSCMKECVSENEDALKGCTGKHPPKDDGDDEDIFDDEGDEGDDQDGGDEESDYGSEEDEGDDDDDDADDGDGDGDEEYEDEVFDDDEYESSQRRALRGSGGRKNGEQGEGGKKKGDKVGKEPTEERYSKLEECKSLRQQLCGECGDDKQCFKQCLDATKDALAEAGCKAGKKEGGKRRKGEKEPADGEKKGGNGGEGNNELTEEQKAKREACKSLRQQLCGECEDDKQCFKQCLSLDATKEALKAAGCKGKKKGGRGKGKSGNEE